MTLEATAGKNPVTHVGKLYNLVAPRIAAAIVAQLPEVKDATCVLVSRIGYPVSDPYLIDIGLAREARSGAKEVILDIAHAELARIPELRSELLAETLPVC
jgi:S-adenosylmethionine synthetase